MRSLHSGSGTWFLVFDRGDELVAAMRRFAEDNDIRGAHFVGIGAFEKTTIAWWDWASKEYEKREIDEQVEVLSVIGDISVFKDEVRVHAHTTLGRRDGIAVGGHLFSGIVRPTLEVQLVDYGVVLERKMDPASKLPLF